jgi:hypothetical protein
VKLSKKDIHVVASKSAAGGAVHLKSVRGERVGGTGFTSINPIHENDGFNNHIILFNLRERVNRKINF